MSTRRVLLVDDDPDHELLLQLAAQDAGVEIVTRVDHLDDLADAIAEHDPDLIFLDIWLEDVRTTDRIDDIRGVIGDIPVVIWTHDPWAVAAPSEGQFRLLDKMAPRADLVAALASA